MLVINEKFKAEVGKRLRELRERKGMTINEVVERLSNEYYSDVDEKSIRRYEKGEFLPKTDNLVCLAELFGTTLDYIVYGKKTSDDNSFTWYDQFKRLNRLIYSLTLGFYQDSADGKIFIELWDEEAKIYWERLQSFSRDKNYSFEVREGDPTFTVDDLDDLFMDFKSYKEQLYPTPYRLYKMMISHGQDPEEYLHQKIKEIERKRGRPLVFHL